MSMPDICGRFSLIPFFRGNPNHLYTFLPLASFAEHKYKNSTCEKSFCHQQKSRLCKQALSATFSKLFISGLHYRRSWCNTRNFGVEIEFLQLAEPGLESGDPVSSSSSHSRVTALPPIPMIF